MRASIGKRDDPGLVLDQRLDPLVDGVEEAANQAGLEVLVEPEVERVATSFTRDLGDGAVGEIGILGFHRAAIMTRCQFPWNTVPGLGFRRSARNRSRKLGSPNTVFSC